MDCQVFKSERILKNGVKKVSWYVMYRIKDPANPNKSIQKKKCGFKTKAEAQRYLTKLQNEIINGDYVKEIKMTVTDLMNEWLDFILGSDLSPCTVDGYIRNVRLYIKPTIGHIKLQNLKHSHIQMMLRELVDPNGMYKIKPNTARKAMINLNMALKHALLSNYINKNPAANIKNPKVIRVEKNIYEPEQIKTLLEVTKNMDIWIGLNLCATLGLRRGEALGLKWQDIDFESKTINIVHAKIPTNKGGLVYNTLKEPKQDSRRKLVMPDFLIEGLKREKIRQKENMLKYGTLYTENGFVCRHENGVDIKSETFSRKGQAVFNRLSREQGFKRISLHDLRHSAASYLLNSGIDMFVVKTILGHSTISVTVDYYGHIFNNSIKKAAATIDETYKINKEESPNCCRNVT